MKYGEISHFSHPQHKLQFEYAQSPFKCDGCKEIGLGASFKCNLCDYDLHSHCATAAPSTVLRHPFYPKCTFYFLTRPPGEAARFCNACEKDVKGFVYHCYSCGFDLHPCCANLPHVIDANASDARYGAEIMTLYLHRKGTSPCHRCGRKGRSWSYRSGCKRYSLDVACVMEMLVESWHEIYYGGGFGNGVVMKSASVSRGFSMGNGNYTSASNKYSNSGKVIPRIGGVGVNYHGHRGKGKVQKCCEVAAMAAQFVISAVLGDPTAMIAGLVGSFISR